MPCNSDHLEPHSHEIEGSKCWLVLDEIHTGKHIDPHKWASGTDRREYSKGYSKDVMDSLVALTCATLKREIDRNPDAIKSMSLELQLWWRNHQKADKNRK